MTALVLVLFFGAVLVWLVFSISTGSVHAVTKLISHISNFYKDFSVRRADQKKQATLQSQKQQIDTHRRTQPVQIVGLPDLSYTQTINRDLPCFRLRSIAEAILSGKKEVKRIGEVARRTPISTDPRRVLTDEARTSATSLLPGTELSFAEEVRKVRSWPWRLVCTPFDRTGSWLR